MMYLNSFKDIVKINEIAKFNNDRFELGVYDCINSKGEKITKLVEYDFIWRKDEVIQEGKNNITNYLNNEIISLKNSMKYLDNIMQDCAKEMIDNYTILIKQVI